MRTAQRITVLLTRFRLICLALAFAAVPLPAGADEGPTNDEIKTILRNFVERDHWGVGIVAGIVDEHGVRVINYGRLDTGDGPEVNGDTLFEIGSITKTFTTLLLQDMVERGEVRLDDPVEKFLPASVKVPDWEGRKITLLDLGTHTAGLRTELPDFSVPGMYAFLSNRPLLWKPGPKVHYSNLGVALLAHAIERKAGTNFEVLVQQRICAPLAMNSTCIRSTPELRPRWSKSHGNESRPVNESGDYLAALPGAGALRSTVNDLLKYAAAEIGLTNSPLTPAMEKTHAVRHARAFGDADVALPWWVYHWDGAELITHGGDTAGQAAFIGFDKQSKRGVVVLANRSDYFHQAVRSLGMFLLHPPDRRPVPVAVAPSVLDSYAGLYEFPELPQTILTIRRDGDRLFSQLLNSAGGEWLAQSDTEFIEPWFESRMKFARRGRGGMEVSFTQKPGRGGKTWRARRISKQVPDSLFQPMSRPLSAEEYASRAGSELRGTWAATVRPWFWPFVSRHGTLNIAERSPGILCAELNAPAEQVDKLPVAVIYHSPDVEFAARSAGGMFKGRINSDRTKIVGRLFQGNSSIRAVLRRVESSP